jgi:hypothetical protein
MNKRHFFIFFILLSIVFTSSGCEISPSISNPLTGSWKSGLFNFTFNSDKTFKLEIGSALSFEKDGSYEYDKENIYLSFSDDSKATFKYDFNENKTELSLNPETEFKWFKATLKFNKAKN